MRTIGKRLGKILWLLSWPAYMVYFRLGERTRVLLISGDEVLLLKTWVGNGQWNLPGGGLHWREEPVVGAVREVWEETGIALQSSRLTLLGKEVYRNNGIVFTYYVFVASVDKTVQLARQRHEVSDLQWHKLSAVSPRTCSQEVVCCARAAKKAGLLQ